MCFSATASLVTGTILSIVGVYTIKQTKAKNIVPFASIPLFFGIQQLIEGVVWLSFGTPSWHLFSVYAFLLIAYVFWPIFVPLSIRLIETGVWRKRALTILSVLGGLVGIYLLARIVFGPVTAEIISNSICYTVPVPYPAWSFALYFLAICGASVLSSAPKIRIFGTAVLLSFFLANLYYPETLFSVWCFFSAILSLIITLHMRKKNGFAAVPIGGE